MIHELIKKYSKIDPDGIKVVFTHSSFINENLANNTLLSNERLEYLGAVSYTHLTLPTNREV